MQLVLRWLPVTLWSALILSAANESFSAEQSSGWLRALFGRDLPYTIHVLVRKAAHIIEYAILGALAWRAQRGLLIPTAIGLAVAATDETLQGLTTVRTGSIADVALDLCSALIVIALRQRAISPRTEPRRSDPATLPSGDQ